MKWAAIGAAALILAASSVNLALAAEAIKPGRWQFTTRLQAAAPAPPASTTPSPHGAASPSSGATATYTGCIRSETAVPAELGPQCKLGGVERHSSRLTWSMTCTNSQGSVRSDGVAQYHGDTMEATMVSHLPNAGGAVTDMTQHIAGHYLGPCLQAAAMPMTPSHPNAPSDSPAATAPPATAGQGAAPQAAAANEAVPAQGLPEIHRARHRRYARYRHYRYQRYYGSGWYGSAPYSTGYGPGP